MRADQSTADSRPALTQKGTLAEIEDLLAERNPYYERASDFVVQTDGMLIDKIAQKILAQLNEDNIETFWC